MKDYVLKGILKLDVSKASLIQIISSRLTKENADILTDFPHSIFNNSINQTEFPENIKLANITSVSKKGNMGLEKVATNSIVCWGCWKNRKIYQIKENVLEHYWPVYLSHS